MPRRKIGNKKTGFTTEQAAVNAHIMPDIQPGERVKVRNVEITGIDPDPLQPRTVIPGSIRGDWIPNGEEMQNFIQHWINESRLDVPELFQLDDDDEMPEGEGPVQTALLRVISLAKSIRRDGLTNPITVTGNRPALIETGERRWVAYHLLHFLYPDDGYYEKIPARQMPDRSLLRQATENSARADLNAIAKARQYALLIMYYAGEDLFRPLADFEHEQGFYAQAASHRVPYGRADDICNAMGLKIRQVRYLSQLLKLSYEAWQMADEYDVPEAILRPVIGHAQDEMDAIQSWISGQIRNSVPNSQKKAAAKKAAAWEKKLDSLEKTLAVQKWRKMEPEDREAAINRLRALLIHLENL